MKVPANCGAGSTGVYDGPMTPRITLTIDGEEYVAVPRAEYDARSRGSVDALEFARRSIASSLRTARATAGLTQMRLAKKMGVSPMIVRHAEGGTSTVSESFVLSFLKACGLPKNWKG